jgi:ABC-type branched-subunit amino acid transport system permease subunit
MLGAFLIVTTAGLWHLPYILAIVVAVGIMAVVGGMRSFWGPLVGAAGFVTLQDYLSSQTQNWMSFLGVIFVLSVLFFPRGLLGLRLSMASLRSGWAQIAALLGGARKDAA